MISNSLPHNARVWVYQSNRNFTEQEVAQIELRLKEFVNQWTSHKVGVVGDGAILYNRFIVLMADEERVKLGGCSIDSSVHFIKAVEGALGLNFFDRWNIAYMDGETVKSCNRAEFEALVKQGTITENTIVFNNLVQTKYDLLNSWQLPFGKSWLKNLAPADSTFTGIL
ncbi:MAG: hypothetical protein U0V74_06275 [Chitinophagales bacterium]